MSTSSGMMTTTIQAPWMNFVTMKTQSTTKVATAPKPLTAIDFFQFVGLVTSSSTNFEMCMSSLAASIASGIAFRPLPFFSSLPGVSSDASPVAPRFSLRVFARSASQCLTIPDSTTADGRWFPRVARLNSVSRGRLRQTNCQQQDATPAGIRKA